MEGGGVVAIAAAGVVIVGIKANPNEREGSRDASPEE